MVWLRLRRLGSAAFVAFADVSFTLYRSTKRVTAVTGLDKRTIAGDGPRGGPFPRLRFRLANRVPPLPDPLLHSEWRRDGAPAFCPLAVPPHDRSQPGFCRCVRSRNKYLPGCSQNAKYNIWKFFLGSAGRLPMGSRRNRQARARRFFDIMQNSVSAARLKLQGNQTLLTSAAAVLKRAPRSSPVALGSHASRITHHVSAPLSYPHLRHLPLYRLPTEFR